MKTKVNFLTLKSLEVLNSNKLNLIKGGNQVQSDSDSFDSERDDIIVRQPTYPNPDK